jgi:hypothetical protein
MRSKNILEQLLLKPFGAFFISEGIKVLAKGKVLIF